MLQRSAPVGPTDTATDLLHKTVVLIGPIIIDALALIASGHIDWITQDRSKASFFHKRSIEDSRIDWTWPAQDIERLIRAQSAPYPTRLPSTVASAFAYCRHRCRKLGMVVHSAVSSYTKETAWSSSLEPTPAEAKTTD